MTEDRTTTLRAAALKAWLNPDVDRAAAWFWMFEAGLVSTPTEPVPGEVARPKPKPEPVQPVPAPETEQTQLPLEERRAA